jgi:hypothetical protein
MSVELQYPHITKPSDGPAHLDRIPRIHVAMLARDYLFYGWSIEEMCRQHPYLKPAEAHAAMAYYFDHQEEIEAEILAEQQAVRETTFRDSPFARRMRSAGKL